MYCHYIDWCIGKCPLYRGVLYSECPLSEVPLYRTCVLQHVHTSCIYTLPRSSVELPIGVCSTNLHVHVYSGNTVLL